MDNELQQRKEKILKFLAEKKNYLIYLALAVLAIENQALVYSLDRHFKLIARHSPLKLFEPVKH